MRELVIWPNQILMRPTLPVVLFDDRLSEIIDDMFSVMKKFGGLGLAAPQVGEALSVIVYDCDGERGILVNPALTPTPDAREEETNEGCLSFPGVYIKRRRPNIFDLKWQDEEGEEHEDEFYGLLAVVLGHELDHLEGKTLVNHLSSLKRDLVTRKMKKIQRRRKKHLQHLKKIGKLDELQATEGRDSRDN